MEPLLAAIHLPTFDPVALHLGPLAIRWYGLAYLAAFAVAYAGLIRQAKHRSLRVTHDQVGDLVMWCVMGVMIGGRLGWWLVYSRPSEGARWYEALAVWHGGMSFHGGLAGVGVAVWAWCRRHGADVADVADVADALAVVAPVGLFFGRIANFINGELVGRATAMPWGVVFPGDTAARHPSQLYEAMLEGVVLGLVILVVARRRPRPDGLVAAIFVLGYALARTAVEFTREPDAQIGFVAAGWLTMGQVLSGLMLLAGMAWLVAVRRRTPHDTGIARPCANAATS